MVSVEVVHWLQDAALFWFILFVLKKKDRCSNALVVIESHLNNKWNNIYYFLSAKLMDPFCHVVGDEVRIVITSTGIQVVMVAVMVNLKEDWNTLGSNGIIIIYQVRFLLGLIDYLWETSMLHLMKTFLVMRVNLWILKVACFLSISSETCLIAVNPWLTRLVAYPFLPPCLL